MAAGDRKERDFPAAKKKLNPGSSFAGAGKDVYGRSHREQRRAKDRLNKPGMRIGRDRRLNHGVKTVHSGCRCRSPTPLPGSQRETPESRRHQSRPTWRRARTPGKSQPCPPWNVPERHGGLVHERRSCSPYDDGDRPRPGRRPTGIPGRVAYEQEDYYHSVQWLEESVRLFRGSRGQWSPENEGTLEDALDHLAFSHFKTGNVSYALSLSHELLHHNPMNGRVLQNVKKYEKLLSSAGPSRGSNLRRPSSSYLRTRDTYERLCLTQGSQPMHFKNPRVFCDHFTNNNSPVLLLQPMRREVLSLRPYVVLYHNFISVAEAEDIKKLAQPGLKRSVVAAGEKQETADYRISKSAWLKDSQSSIIGRLDQRISVLTGLNVKHPYGEFLQVVNYGIGGHYEPHFDHATSPSSPVFKLKTGNRVATFMIYLSSVEAGGSTAFIYGNFSVPVVEKAAIFWWNLHRNGHGDEDTLHAGCPVLIGDKWVANKWIHEYGQEFQRRCSLNPEE